MLTARRGGLLWPGMILVGLVLGAVAWALWPEATTRVERRPANEARPKVSAAAPARQGAQPQAPATPTAVPKPRRTAPIAQPTPQEDEEPARVLAVAEPAAPAPPAAKPAATAPAGPAPVPSELEEQEDYVQESPEELGAVPLPGAGATPEPPPVAG